MRIGGGVKLSYKKSKIKAYNTYSSKITTPYWYISTL